MKKPGLSFHQASRKWPGKRGLTFFELIIIYLILFVLYLLATAYSPEPWHFVDEYVTETCNALVDKKDQANLKNITECKESELKYAERYKTLMSVLSDAERESAIAYIKAHDGIPYSEMYDFLTRKKN